MRGEQVNRVTLGFFVLPLVGIALERKLSSEKELMQESHAARGWQGMQQVML